MQAQKISGSLPLIAQQEFNQGQMLAASALGLLAIDFYLVRNPERFDVLDLSV